MKYIRNQKGAISVFLALILLTTFLFSGVVIDGGRIYAARNITSGAGQLALNAALSDYDQALKDAYGLIAMAHTPEEMTDNLQSYFMDSLNACGISEEDFHTALVFLKQAGESEFTARQIDRTEVCRGYVMEQQVLEYMKYRAPVTLVKKGIIDRLKELDLKETKQAKKVAEDEAETAKAANDFQDELEELLEAVEAEIKNYNNFKDYQDRLDEAERLYKLVTVAYVLRYKLSKVTPSEADWEVAMEAFAGQIGTAQTKAANTDELQRYIGMADSMVILQGYYLTLKDVKKDDFVKKYAGENDSNSGSGEEESEDDDSQKVYYEDMYDTYKSQEGAYLSLYHQLSNSIQTNIAAAYDEWSVLYNAAGSMADMEEEVLDKIEKVRSAQTKMKEKYNVWVRDTQKLSNEATKKEIEKSQKEYKDFLEEDGDMAKMERLVKNNKAFYEEFRAYAENTRFEEKPVLEMNGEGTIPVALGENHIASASSTGLAGLVSDTSFGYLYVVNRGNLAFTYYLFDLSDTDINPFYATLKEYCNKEKDKGKAKQTSKDFNKQFQNFLTEMENLFLSEDLKPVANKVNERRAELPTTLLSTAGKTDDAHKTGDKMPEKCEVNNSKSRKNMLNGMTDTLNEDNSVLDGIAKLAEALDSMGEAVAEPVYLTEYVTDMFSCYTSDKTGKKDSNGKWITKSELTSLSGYDLTKNVIYRAEVEYILWGNKQDARINVNQTKAVIFSIQLVGNLIFAFTDKTVTGQARMIAMPFPSAIIRIVVRTVVEAVVAIVETVRDMVVLMNGGRVLILKSLNKGEWRTKPLEVNTWSMDKDESSKNPLALSYEEYLWIMVCVGMMPESNRYCMLERAADCVQMNLSEKTECRLMNRHTMLEINVDVDMDTWLVTDLFNPSQAGLDTGGNYTIHYKGIQGY